MKSCSAVHCKAMQLCVGNNTLDVQLDFQSESQWFQAGLVSLNGLKGKEQIIRP